MRKLIGGVVLGLLAASLGVSAVIAAQGRYKKDGNKCVWDAKDSGPNQCTPQVTGRFKKSGDTCSWVNENGDDDCRPAKGRFKVEGTACVWNGTDTGRDQCDPRAVK